MSSVILEKEYPVNSINININKRLGLFGILGILQDVAATHADILGIGLEQMIQKNAFWVLTQQKLKMKKWPKWQDLVTVKTWPRGTAGLKMYRDFEIFLGSEKIGESVTTYMILDGSTRRPITTNVQKEYGIEWPQAVLDFVPEKILVSDEAICENTIKVRNSDLDMNNHVNNTKYSQWILDSIPFEYHRTVNLQEFDINFLAETRLEDEVDICVEQNNPLEPGVITSLYKGVRKSDNKTVFTARVRGELN